MSKKLLVLYFLMFSFMVAVAKKKSRYVLLTGTVVDTMGYLIPNQKVALVNAKGNDKKIIFSDDYGIFSFKVKRKKLHQFAVSAYNKYSNPTKIKLNEFIQNCKLVLQTNRYYFNHNFVNFITGEVSLSAEAMEKFNGFVGCRGHVYVETSRYPFAFVDANYIRSYFPMVK